MLTDGGYKGVSHKGSEICIRCWEIRVVLSLAQHQC